MSVFPLRDATTTEIYTLSLHDALPILHPSDLADVLAALEESVRARVIAELPERDRKSTRLNSSHLGISYAVFCLKKKKSGRIRQELGSDRQNKQAQGATVTQQMTAPTE